MTNMSTKPKVSLNTNIKPVLILCSCSMYGSTHSDKFKTCEKCWLRVVV